MSEAQMSIVNEFSVFEKMGEEIFYPDKFTKWSISHIWIIALGPLALLLLNDVIVALISPERQVLTELLPDLTDKVFVSVSIVFLIGGFILRTLLRQTPKTFVNLAKTGQLEPIAKESPHKVSFSTDFRTRIKSRRRFGVTLSLLIISGTLIAFANQNVGLDLSERIKDVVNPDRTSLVRLLDTLWILTRWVFTPLLWAIVGSTGIWIMYTLGVAIKRLTPTFKLRIQPSHPDSSGGLRRLGDICFNMALPIILAILVLGFWAIIGIRTNFQYPTLPTIVFSIVGLIILIPLSFFIFLAPLWDIHRDMLEQRSEYQDKLAKQLGEVESRLHKRLQGDDDSKLEELTEELETLQKLHPTARKYPTWPFDTAILLRAISPQIISIMGVALSLDSDTVTKLKDVMENFAKLVG